MTASYKIIWKASAGKEIYNLPRTIIPKIFNEIASLAENPRPVGSRKLRNSKNNYRIRFGDYRVIYSIFKDILIIEIIKIGHRKDIYDKLFR